MLPRRHILDVCQLMKDEDEILSMSTITLAIDAVKYMDTKPRKDHLVEALELNEFICYMYPLKRPMNRSLLFHVVSDLLGLLMYGVPKKSRKAIGGFLGGLETINYSEKGMEAYPVIEVWNALKEKTYSKKHGAMSVIEGFIKKIRIEMDIIERFPQVDEIFFKSLDQLKGWLPALSRYYDKRPKTIKNSYEKWWSIWYGDGDKENILTGMVERLCAQAEREFAIDIEKEETIDLILNNPGENRKESDLFSRWYLEGVNLLLKI